MNVLFPSVDSTTNWNMYVSDPSSSKQRVWLCQPIAYYSYLFSILLHLTFQQCLFKDYKCIFAITTSNYSFQFQLRGFPLIGLDIAQAHVWPCPLLDQPTSPSE